MEGTGRLSANMNLRHYSARRRESWDQYNYAAAELPLRLPAAQQVDIRHAYHLYTVMIDSVGQDYLCDF